MGRCRSICHDISSNFDFVFDYVHFGVATKNYFLRRPVKCEKKPIIPELREIRSHHGEKKLEIFLMGN